MTRTALLPIPLAALLACSGCAVRMAMAPAAALSTGEPRREAPDAARPQREGDDRVAAQEGPTTSSAVSSPAEPPPAAVTPGSVDREAAGEQRPAATSSLYVFSAQQAATSPPPALPTEEAASEGEAQPSEPGEPAAGELQLLVVASTREIVKGGITIVDVIASSSTGVVDAPLHLTFDPAVMEFVDGATGDFLTQGGSSVVFLADGRSRPGDVAIAAGRLEREHGASGAGLLCRVRLRGVGPGTTSVHVGEARAWGAQGQELAVLKGGTTVAVN